MGSSSNFLRTLRPLRIAAFAVAVLAGAVAHAQSQAGTQQPGHDTENLARQLSNPVAALISVPFQLNDDRGIGPSRDGEKTTLNFQPVVPIGLDADWNVISRTIVPFVRQKDIFPGSGRQSGVGDITQSFFFSPRQPTANGVIWGAGPVILLPTASDELLGTEKWGLGPTAVVLRQQDGWTYGALANHIWSVGGASDRADISATYLQPFVSHTHGPWTYTVNLESTYDWKGKQWTVPLNVSAGKLTTFGRLPVSITGGLRYWLDSPEGGPHGWGFRLTVTLLLPT